MNDYPRTGRFEEFPILQGFIWLVASLIGLWFACRAVDPRQISFEALLPYIVYTAFIFLAFECGRYLGGMFHARWENYVSVFISVAVPTLVVWFVWGVKAFEEIPIYTRHGETIWTIDAVQRSNVTATLFVAALIPACYGAFSRQRDIKYGERLAKKD
jgi:hypothetical protein